MAGPLNRKKKRSIKRKGGRGAIQKKKSQKRLVDAKLRFYKKTEKIKKKKRRAHIGAEPSGRVFQSDSGKEKKSIEILGPHLKNLRAKKEKRVWEVRRGGGLCVPKAGFSGEVTCERRGQKALSKKRGTGTRTNREISATISAEPNTDFRKKKKGVSANSPSKDGGVLNQKEIGKKK